MSRSLVGQVNTSPELTGRGETTPGHARRSIAVPALTSPLQVSSKARNDFAVDLTGYSPGVHYFQDPRTGVFNFEPETLHTIPQPSEFAFDRIPSYIPPAKDAVSETSNKYALSSDDDE